MKDSKRGHPGSGALARDFADLLPEIIFETDLAGVLTYVNRRAFDATGYTREDFEQGLRALDIIDPADRERAALAMQEIMTSGGSGPQEYTARRKDGSSFPVLIHSVAVLRDGRPAGLRGIIIDMTERERNELERQQDIIRREKLRGVLEMAGATCHEFNQPMQVISGYTELLLRDLPENDRGYEVLSRIKTACDRMIEITRKLQQITRYETREYVGGATIIDIDRSSSLVSPDEPGE
jgi:two-component system cell cycle sensor histidine kinase/response regulator CckA